MVGQPLGSTPDLRSAYPLSTSRLMWPSPACGCHSSSPSFPSDRRVAAPTLLGAAPRLTVVAPCPLASGHPPLVPLRGSCWGQCTLPPSCPRSAPCSVPPSWPRPRAGFAPPGPRRLSSSGSPHWVVVPPWPRTSSSMSPPTSSTPAAQLRCAPWSPRCAPNACPWSSSILVGSLPVGSVPGHRPVANVPNKSIISSTPALLNRVCSVMIVVGTPVVSHPPVGAPSQPPCQSTPPVPALGTLRLGA
jgi:hypothetical protein